MSNIESHFSASEIINQIEYDFSEQQIDVARLYDIIATELRNFGDLITIPAYGFVHIKNKIGKLPEDFRSLIYAALVEPDECNAPLHTVKRLVDSKYYIEREEYGFTTKSEREYCDNSLYCQDTCNCNLERKIVEKLYYEDVNVHVAYSYKNPLMLSLSRNTRNSNIISKDCENLKVYNEMHEVSIYNNKMETNFNQGVIFMRYNAMPVDDEGVPMIPNGKTDAMREYIDKRLRVAIMEDPKLLRQIGDYAKTFYAIFKQELPMLKSNAMGDLKHIKYDQIAKAVQYNRNITVRHSVAYKDL